MTQSKGIRFLFIPLIFMIALLFPAMILGIASLMNIQEFPSGIMLLYGPILIIAMEIWSVCFYDIPLVAYIGFIAIYIVISCLYIFGKNENKKYAMLMLFLGMMSILMYWKFGWLYRSMINR